MLLQTNTFPEVRGKSVHCSVTPWEGTCLSTWGLSLFAQVAAWCHLENVVIVARFLSRKSKAVLFQLDQLACSQLRGACGVTVQMQKPFTGFEMLVVWVLYRTSGTQESFGIDFILAYLCSHFSIYDCLGIGSGNGYWNTTCQKQRWLKQMMWFFRVMVQNQGRKGVKEKTSLHTSSVNFRIERPGTTVRVNLKQSALLLYCEKWWR